MYYDGTAPTTYSVLEAGGYLTVNTTPTGTQSTNGYNDVVIINGIRYVQMVVESHTDNYPGGNVITTNVWMEPATDEVYDQLDLIHGFNVAPLPKYYPLPAVAPAGIRLWPQARAPPVRLPNALDLGVVMQYAIGGLIGLTLILIAMSLYLRKLTAWRRRECDCPFCTERRSIRWPPVS